MVQSLKCAYALSGVVVECPEREVQLAVTLPELLQDAHGSEATTVAAPEYLAL